LQVRFIKYILWMYLRYIQSMYFTQYRAVAVLQSLYTLIVYLGVARGLLCYMLATYINYKQVAKAGLMKLQQAMNK
jgi:hypothetical protein